MGHMIHYRVFSDEERRGDEAEAWADECYADGHDWGEDPFGMFPDRIEYSAHAPFSTKEDAYDWIEEKAKGMLYCSMAARFTEGKYPSVTETADRQKWLVRIEYHC